MSKFVFALNAVMAIAMWYMAIRAATMGWYAMVTMDVFVAILNTGAVVLRLWVGFP